MIAQKVPKAPQNRVSYLVTEYLSLRSESLQIILLTLLFVYVAYAIAPYPPIAATIGLDGSWRLGLNLAHAQALVAGRDFVFTYGPLGYLLYPDPVSGSLVSPLVFRITLYVLSLALLARLVKVVTSRATAFWLLLIVMTGVAFDPLSYDYQLDLVLILLAVLALVDLQWRTQEVLLLSAFAAVACLVKLNQGIAGIMLLCVVVGTTAYQERPLSRRRLWMLIGIVALMPALSAVFYLFSTGTVSTFPAYIYFGLEIISGYSEAMAIAGPLWQTALAILSTSLLVVAVVFLMEDRRVHLPGLLPALLVAFLAFKHAMVRQDGGHASSFHARFAIAALFLLVLARTSRDRRLIVSLQLFSIGMAMAVSVAEFPGFKNVILSRFTWQHGFLRPYLNWPETWRGLALANENMRSSLKLDERYHKLIGNGTVDSLPWEIDRVTANGWSWQPRPVFQSYSAYTPALDILNAEHIEGVRAADFMLLSFLTIDARHLFVEDSVSWSTILDRYKLVLNDDQVALLERSEEPRFDEMVPLGSSTMRFNQDIPVPAGHRFILAKARLQQSLTGSLQRLLLRVNPVYIHVKYASGRIQQWRVVPSNLANGFIVAPFPHDFRELKAVLNEDWDHVEKVTEIRFQSASPAQFRDEIAVQWYHLPLSAKRDVRQLVDPPVEKLTALWLPGQDRLPVAHNARVRLINGVLKVTPQADDPQVTFRMKTPFDQVQGVVIRAKLPRPDRVDVFFGKQIDGRGMAGEVGIAGRWVDIYIHLAHNAFWLAEHGSDLRFDPVQHLADGAEVEISGIWGMTGDPAYHHMPTEIRPVVEPVSDLSLQRRK